MRFMKKRLRFSRVVGVKLYVAGNDVLDPFRTFPDPL